METSQRPEEDTQKHRTSYGLGKNWRFFDIDEPLELRNLLNSPLVARATRKSAVYIEGSSSSQEDEAVEEKKDKIWALKNMPQSEFVQDYACTMLALG